MKTKWFFVAFIYMGLILGGCQTDFADSQTHPGPAPSSPSSEIAYISESDTPTIEIPGETLTPRGTVESLETLLPTFEITPATAKQIPTCENSGLPSPLDDHFGLSGVIAFRTFEEDSQTEYQTMGGSPLVYARLPLPRDQEGRTSFSPHFSPNGAWLGFAYPDRKTLGVLSFDGTILEHEMDFTFTDAFLPEDAHIVGLNFGNWVNNELAEGWFAINSEGTSTLWGFISILDPFEGIWRDDLVLNLPGLNRHETVNFSPDLSRVVYQNWETSTGWVMYDPSSNTNLWVPPKDTGNYLTFKWNHDSSIFAYNELGTARIFLVDREAQTEKSVQAPLTTGTARIKEFLWAPQTNLLAFTVAHTNREGSRLILFIYDLGTYEFIFQCPLIFLEEEGPFNLVWSPDSRQIAYSSSSVSPLVLLDIHTGLVLELHEHADIIGWSEKFPTTWP